MYICMYRHHSDNASMQIDKQGWDGPMLVSKVIDQQGVDGEETPPSLKTAS